MKKNRIGKRQTSGCTTDDALGYHVPVLLTETLAALNIQPTGVYVDCTFGGGGHAAAILNQLGEGGRLIAFDHDADAAENLPEDDRLLFVPYNFRHLKRFLRLHHIAKVDGILADLGVSSHQFDEAERGFSTRSDAAMDMRMDRKQSKTAFTVVETYSELQLHKLFEKYGEVTNAKTLAKTIVNVRKTLSLQTVESFKNAIRGIVKGNPNRYFAQVFQALRIEVNDEMEALKDMLEQTKDVLNMGGRLVVITFHSIEDRMVKHFLKQGTFEEKEDNPFITTVQKSEFKIITKKPIVAGEEELKRNPRARSAKLRVAEKI